MQCLKCGNENSADAKFCRGCGNKLEEVEPVAVGSFVKCSKCGHANETSKKFCPKCGMALITTTPIPSPSAPDNPPPEIEPKIVLAAKAEAEQNEQLKIHADEEAKASLQEQERLAEAPRAKFELWRDRVWGNSEKKLLTVICAVVAIVFVITALLWTMKKDISVQNQRLATSAPTRPTSVYTNPFAYCKAVVDQDGGEGGVEDSRYVGANPPAVVVNAMMKKFPNITGPYTWRCMDGDVYGCYMGASGRACMKPESSNSQRQILAMRQFCQQNPNSNVPNAVNNTASQWRCNGIIPVIDNTYPTAPVDKRGYYKEAWHKIEPSQNQASNSPATSTASVHPDSGAMAQQAKYDQNILNSVTSAVRNYFGFVQAKQVDRAILAYSASKRQNVKRNILEAVARETEYYRIERIEPQKIEPLYSKILVYIWHKKIQGAEEYWEIAMELVNEQGEWKILSTPGKRLR